jgi:hypothetical protein
MSGGMRCFVAEMPMTVKRARRRTVFLGAALAAYVLFAWGALPAAGDINATIQLAGADPAYTRFPWRAGSLAVGDFNGDGQIDAAAAGAYAAGVAIVFGGGQQTWVGTDSWPIALAAADFNADGAVDLAVAEQDSGAVSILTNDGVGGFTRTGSYGTTEEEGEVAAPSAVVAVDINRDGRMDLAVANRGADTVVVLRNTGSSFVLQQVPYVPGEPSALCVADVNNDGRADVAVTCAADDTVKILKNTGGFLSLAGTFEAGPYPEAVAAADLDGDGKIDLAVADREAAQVMVLLNDGTGRFTSKPVLLAADPNAAFDPPVDLQLVDMNVDGRVDIRCAGMVLLNKGNADFVVCNTNTWYQAVYGQGFALEDPTVFTGVAYRTTMSAGSNAVAVSHPQMGPIPGDVNGDLHVDVTDLLALAGSWGTNTGDAGFNPACDSNGDGRVDVSDLLILAGKWGV